MHFKGFVLILIKIQKTSGYYRKVCFSVTVLYPETNTAETLQWAYPELGG